ncbi:MULTISPECIES: PTS sugar transporter subunit IIB [unclassified Amedibacterium]|jgi:cellobiose PTS system EIIB component|uniref:PTS sugar transporter subunit IIB n=1 Tax=unclassified Amedibacterium TaxID=3088137 RepID=UPI000E3F54A8|nr:MULTISPECIES: PTS sugar transporter subunit IIB [unclassified Absiella]RGB69201.1 PTS sugar transporter subunit IIB [Absiella sp. AM09-45]RGB79183.1 PTS sugar transporter subunit IIB [Absiella sp. AM09-50]RGC53741.1 PTS sugar transporter subunit IIB [Absiella sp. AM29-15]
MPKYNILLCCGAGMSSGFLAQRAQKAADMKQADINIDAKSQSVVEDVLEDYQLLLLGPHYESHLDEFEEMAEPYDIPVAVIPQKIYGALDGEGLVDFALEQLEK